jgi:hypothetical protein
MEPKTLSEETETDWCNHAWAHLKHRLPQQQSGEAILRDKIGVFGDRLSDAHADMCSLMAHWLQLTAQLCRCPTGSSQKKDLACIPSPVRRWTQANIMTGTRRSLTVLLLPLQNLYMCVCREGGNVIEHFLTSKMNMILDFQLTYHLLRYSIFNMFSPDAIQIQLTVKNHLFKYATNPPENFHIFPDEDMICMHIDQYGSKQQRVDPIHHITRSVVLSTLRQQQWPITAMQIFHTQMGTNVKRPLWN